MNTMAKRGQDFHRAGDTSQLSSHNEKSICRIPPYFYLHVLDQTSNVTRVETGPKTYVRNENENIILDPEKMIIIPPYHYCIILNPVLRNEDNALVYDSVGQIKLRHADLEVRLEQDPFPLYPGEVIHTEVTPLTIVPSNCALRLKALRDFDDEKIKRIAGDEWLFEGPGTYVPRKEVVVVETVQAVIINLNQALKLRARAETKDRNGADRVTGEEWIVKKTGAYLPGAYEEVVGLVQALILTEKEAVHVKARKTFTDEFGKIRKNGDQWLITLKETDTYIPDVYVDVIGIVQITTINNRQYCVILDPVDGKGRPQLGHKKLVKGNTSFFLQPGEQLEAGVQDIYVLGENEGLILRAKEAFEDTSAAQPIKRSPGEKWMIKGPTEYIPPIEVEIVTKRYAIALDENEGIYVRNIKSGQVRLVSGSTYMLTHDEELWVKELPPDVKKLIHKGCKAYDLNEDDHHERNYQSSSSTMAGATNSEEESAKAFTLHVPHNFAVQIYDYKQRKARVVFGPDLVMLEPDEQFTQLSLSGRNSNCYAYTFHTLCLFLGPHFCRDKIEVETADHALFDIELLCNWYFDVGDKSPEAASKLFSVPDFSGDLRKVVTSRVRDIVAGTNFDDFIKNSARIIRTAVFGLEENKVRKSFHFPQNNLYITSVDIMSVEPLGEATTNAKEKSLVVAREITTQSQEETARYKAWFREQEAHQRMERQKISHEVQAAAERQKLKDAELEHLRKAREEELEYLRKAREEELEYLKKKNEIEAVKNKQLADIEVQKLASVIQSVGADTIKSIASACQDFQNEIEAVKSKQLADIEVQKLTSVIQSVGADTIKSIASACQDFQVKLFQGLGLQSALITDGKSPINNFNSAQGVSEAAIESSRSKRQRTDRDYSAS